MRQAARALAIVVLVTVAALSSTGAPAAGGPVVCPAETLRIEAADATPTFVSPSGAAVDGDGNIYVLDSGRDTVYRFDSTGTQTLAIEPSDATPNFQQISDVATDPAGNIYTVDSSFLSRVYRFDSDGNQTLSFAVSSTPDGPAGVDADAAGNIYVAENFDRAVYRYDSSGTRDLTITGSAATPTFNEPVDVAADTDGNILITDARGFAAGGHAYRMDSTGTQTLVIDDGDRNEFDPFRPFGIDAGPSGDIVLSDISRSAVIRYDADGHETLRLGSLSGVRGIAVDGAGDIIVPADGVVRRFCTPDPTRIRGRVTEGGVAPTADGDELSGLFVGVFDTTANPMRMRGDITDSAGTYSVSVDPGDYHIAFFDPTRSHAFEYHDNAGAIPAAVSVADQQSVRVDADVISIPVTPSPDPATVTGTVGPGGSGVTAGVWVVAVDSSGRPGGVGISSSQSADYGDYVIDGLAPGDWRFIVVDPKGTHAVEWYEDSADWPGARVVQLAAGETATVDPVIGSTP